MLQAMIRLTSVGDVKTFVGIARQYPFRISLKSGRYTVTGKSMMGIFCLDLTKVVYLEAETNDMAMMREFTHQLQPLIVKKT